MNGIWFARKNGLWQGEDFITYWVIPAKLSNEQIDSFLEDNDIYESEPRVAGDRFTRIAVFTSKTRTLVKLVLSWDI